MSSNKTPQDAKRGPNFDAPAQTGDERAEQAPSKTERKRQATALQTLGKRLTELKPERWAQLDLPQALTTAIADYRRFSSREAKRRQLQYIGRLMRDTDTALIEQRLATWDGQSAEAVYHFHQLERWRDRLLDDTEALTEFLDEHPAIDRQQLRHQLKKAASATTEQERKTQARALFRFIRDAIDQADQV